MVRALADNPISIVVRGQVSDTKLARMIGVDRETVRKWKKPVPGRENEYQADFAAACRACQDAVDADRIKRSMVEKAQGFVQRKVKKRVNELGKLEIVEKEETKMAGDVGAARLVLHNIQKQMPEAERWDTSDKIQATHEMGKSLAEFLKDFGSDDGDA